MTSRSADVAGAARRPTVRRKWGSGHEDRKDWLCICETLNRYYLTRCDMCEITRELAEEAKETTEC